MDQRNAQTTLGAYGFRLVMERGEDHFADLVPLDHGAPAVTVVLRDMIVSVDHEEVSDDHVAIGRRLGGGYRITRDPASIEVSLTNVSPGGALVHPILTLPISVLARWRGDVTLHAGAFATRAGAWAVVGEREAGKSTMLASLGVRGHAVVADDLLTIQEGKVLAGPRCVDLRPDVAQRFDEARFLGEVGGRPRYRLTTPAAGGVLPLLGVFWLGWSANGAVTAEPLPRRELLALLYRQEYIGLLGPADPKHILDLLAVPAWRFERPRDWDATEEACAAILTVTQSLEQ